MEGASVEATGHINVTCVYAGTCAETYSLDADFTGPDTWEGTFTASYSGSCYDCEDQSWDVTGTRP
jgi:hypothetical protein